MGRYILPRRGRRRWMKFRVSTKIASVRDGLHSLGCRKLHHFMQGFTLYAYPIILFFKLVSEKVFHSIFTDCFELAISHHLETDQIQPSLLYEGLHFVRFLFYLLFYLTYFFD